VKFRDLFVCLSLVLRSNSCLSHTFPNPTFVADNRDLSAVCTLKLQRAVRCRHSSVPKPLSDADVGRRQVSAAVRGFSVYNVSVPTQTVRYYKGSVAASIHCSYLTFLSLNMHSNTYMLILTVSLHDDGQKSGTISSF
jgi:hypothetical protein